VLAATASAAAGATATIGVSRADGVRPLGQADGVLRVAFEANATLRFEVRLVDDAGQVVDDCLANGLEVHVIEQATGAVLGARGCAEGDGVFRIPSRQVTGPTRVVATVAAGARDSGAPVSATESNAVRVLIVPRIIDTSPTSVVAKTFPFRGRVLLARADRAGRIALERRAARRWVRTTIRGLPANGRFEFRVGNGAWRARFVPRAGSGYVESCLHITVRRRAT
jgi:hypothetical protein